MSDETQVPAVEPLVDEYCPTCGAPRVVIYKIDPDDVTRRTVYRYLQEHSPACKVDAKRSRARA